MSLTDTSEALTCKLYALEALLAHTYGEAREAFLALDERLIDAYLGHCSDLATECKTLASQINEQAFGDRRASKDDRAVTGVV
jgi:hypothetical protein